MKRRRFGKFKDLELALEMEIRETIVTNYRHE